MSDKQIDPVRAATSRIGLAVQHGDPEQIANAYRQLHVARILRAANNALHGEYAITQEQRNDLALFFLNGGQA
ncbi:hypothetical protein [Nocardioides sp.]|uniref:hypothetical protein n=1 Tax=Nocardioides sp. TaxID=35761 RepID=UPI0035668988